MFTGLAAMVLPSSVRGELVAPARWAIGGVRRGELDTGGVVWHTRDLVQWSRVTSAADLRPRSLALLDNVLYVGTTDARLFRLDGWQRPP